MTMTKLSFHRRPMPIFAEYRPLYKIAQILLVLSLSSRSGKSSLIRLQLFNWAIKDSERQKLLINSVENRSLEISVWGLDPSLNSAVQFALAERLVERCSIGISLTDLGKKYIEELVKKEVLKEDVEFLNALGKGITESMISRVSESWG